MSSVTITALFTILCHLAFIYLSYQVLDVIRFDVFLHSHQEGKARLLRLLLAIAIGFGGSSFLLSIINNLSSIFFGL
ncbi:DUF1146 family protein [Lapidilactobacillus luobeiensis]|uniref:DUF1146 family protein n=1 Tax=Lapidilactobacillus luobeiensis TaxID=2950371 RepID=UPI0021C342B7|nr:DUF1146 family protein [Lapidilactobacillus luobeiensis]